MCRGGPPNHVAVLHDEESAAGFVGENFEVQMAAGTCSLVRLPCAIRACSHNVDGALFLVRKRTIRGQREGSKYFQHRTAVELMHRSSSHEHFHASRSQAAKTKLWWRNIAITLIDPDASPMSKRRLSEAEVEANSFSRKVRKAPAKATI